MDDKALSSDFYSFGVQNRLSKESESIPQSDKTRPPANVSIISCISERNSLDNQIQLLKSQLLAEDNEKPPDQDLLNKLEELYTKKRVTTSKETPYKHRKCYSRNISVLMGKEDLLKEIENLKDRIAVMEHEQANMAHQLVEALKLVKEKVLSEQSKDDYYTQNLEDIRQYENKSTEEIDQSREYPEQDLQQKPQEEAKKNEDFKQSYKNSVRSNRDPMNSKTCQCVVF